MSLQAAPWQASLVGPTLGWESGVALLVLLADPSLQEWARLVVARRMVQPVLLASMLGVLEAPDFQVRSESAVDLEALDSQVRSTQEVVVAA